MALLALPKPLRDQPMLVRADSAAATHAFTDELARRNLAFSIGFDCDQRVQRAILGLPEPAWQPAVDPDGRPRRGTWVAEQRSPGCGPCRCAADRRTRSIQASEAACRGAGPSMAAELPLPGGSVRFGSSGPTKPGSVPTA